MSEHLSVQQIERYRQRALSPVELLAADDHIAACASCRQQLAEAVQASLTFTWAGNKDEMSAGMEHLAYEQLEAYVDSALDEVDREIVESHLELCAECVAEVRDLRAFRAMMSTYPSKEYAPASPPTLWERIAAFWRRPARWISLQVAGTAAVAALCAYVSTRPLQTKISQLRGQLSQTQKTNDALQKQVAAAGDLKAQLAQLQQHKSQLQTQLAAVQKSNKDLTTRLVALQNQPRTAPAVAGAVSKRALLALNDGGGRVTLDKQGNVSGLPSLSPSVQAEVKTTLTARQVKTPTVLLAQLIGEGGATRGTVSDGMPFVILVPVGTAVPTDRPTFRWQPLNGATSYKVTVFDADFNAIAKSDNLTTTEWTPSQPLSRGEVYQWQVTALKDGKDVSSPTAPAPEAKFKVLEQDKADAIERVKRQHPNSHLTLGVLYAQAGMLDDAEREFQALLNANPKSPVAQKLLNDVRAVRRK
jgi:anti-sigma factor RsiW